MNFRAGIGQQGADRGEIPVFQGLLHLFGDAVLGSGDNAGMGGKPAGQNARQPALQMGGRIWSLHAEGQNKHPFWGILGKLGGRCRRRTESNAKQNAQKCPDRAGEQQAHMVHCSLMDDFTKNSPGPCRLRPAPPGFPA